MHVTKSDCIVDLNPPNDHITDIFILSSVINCQGIVFSMESFKLEKKISRLKKKFFLIIIIFELVYDVVDVLCGITYFLESCCSWITFLPYFKPKLFYSLTYCFIFSLTSSVALSAIVGTLVEHAHFGSDWNIKTNKKRKKKYQMDCFGNFVQTFVVPRRWILTTVVTVLLAPFREISWQLLDILPLITMNFSSSSSD